MSTHTLARSTRTGHGPTSGPARLACRVRVAAALLVAAPRAEQALVAAMVVVAASASWPFGRGPHPFVAVPASLLLAALVRFHTDRLGGRRSALAAAGAVPRDLVVIQAAGPLGAATAGALIGTVAAFGVGHPTGGEDALLPLGSAVLAVLLRPAWAAASALGAAALAAAVASAAVALSTPAGSGTTLVAATHPRSAIDAGHPPWQHAWLPAAVALVVLIAAQVAVRRRHGRERA